MNPETIIDLDQLRELRAQAKTLSGQLDELSAAAECFQEPIGTLKWLLLAEDYAGETLSKLDVLITKLELQQKKSETDSPGSLPGSEQ